MLDPTYCIHRLLGSASEVAQLRAAALELVARSRKLLEEAATDTFLGRQNREMILLPHEQAEEPP